MLRSDCIWRIPQHNREYYAECRAKFIRNHTIVYFCLILFNNWILTGRKRLASSAENLAPQTSHNCSLESLQGVTQLVAEENNNRHVHSLALSKHIRIRLRYLFMMYNKVISSGHMERLIVVIAHLPDPYVRWHATPKVTYYFQNISRIHVIGKFRLTQDVTYPGS
jgi:hypothetical protein